MMRKAAFILLVLLLFAASAAASDIKGPNVKLRGNEIIVSTGVELDPEYLEDIQKGVQKEIVFYVDLFRVWKIWPNEFVLGKRFTQTLHCDPVKNEYIATSTTGNILRERRFQSCARLIHWALNLSDFGLSGTLELEPAEYFVRVTVESRLRRLPPFIDLLFFFVKEKEFSIGEDSMHFPLKREQ